MSCHTCAASFGFLKKELGCPNCGFSFCSKCLKYDVKKIKSTIRVCRSCSQTLSENTDKAGCSKASDMDNKAPDDVYLRHLETLENPSRPPVTVYTQKPNPVLQSFEVKIDPSVPSEQELRGRLQKLRQRLKAAPSVEEMEVRLARLQGMPLKTKSYSMDVSAMPAVSSEEQTRNLLQQLKEESSLPEQSTASWQNEIEARLAKLKGIEPESKIVEPEPTIENMEAEPSDAEGLLRQLSSKIGDTTVANTDEESELAIVNRILAEVDLKEKLGDDDSDEEVISEEVEEELPWCCICNADASLRCPGCAGDLFCSRCFKEGHDVCDMEDHKPVPYKPKCPM